MISLVWREPADETKLQISSTVASINNNMSTSSSDLAYMYMAYV